MLILEIFKTILLGIVQGITEFLPISSTGHMIIFNEFIKLNLSKEFMDLFLILIQLASVLAVIFLYFKKLVPFKNVNGVIRVRYETITLWKKIAVGCLPLVLGVFLDDFIHKRLYNGIVVALMLILYGIFFIVIERMNIKPTVKKFDQLSYRNAFFIGIFQILATVPGTSRSGSTIIGALLLGCSRIIATEFSFFLSIPTMLGASLYKTLKYVLNFGLRFTIFELLALIVGFFASFVVSTFSIKFFTNYLKKHSFSAFGKYRIFLGFVILVYFLIFR